MTQSEVINKMSLEMALALGELDHLKTCKFYLNMALTIGTEVDTRVKDEVIVMNYEGKELINRKKNFKENLIIKL